MADADTNPSFGTELKDAFKPVNAWVSNGIGWLEDLQQFYRERSAIEKEYGTKLSALAKKYHEKKARKAGPLGVGDTPTMTPGSLESASVTTWTTQLNVVEKRASEHERYSAELVSQIADPLRNLALRYEDLRKQHAEYASKLEKERDGAYTSLKRTKGQYDGACQELESKRKKIDSSFDMSKTKAQNAYQQQMADMNNVKNTYLININVTNKQKEKYYHEYVPDLLDSMQDLNETRVNSVNNIWSLASKLEEGTLSRSTSHMQYLSGEIPRNEPRLDSLMFVKHNQSQWQEPADMGFEASPVWHDDASMIVSEAAKVYLRNILGKSKGQRSELKTVVDAKQREVQGARMVRKNVREGRDKRDEVEIVRAIFNLQESLHKAERKWLCAEVEVSTITGVVGDISIGAQNHSFKGQTFKIPTNCDLCGERIWGLSAKGFDCTACGYTCHNKCELKVPANCPGEQNKEQRKKLKAERQAAAGATAPVSNGNGTHEGIAELPDLSRSNTMNSLSSGYAASAHRSVSGSTRDVTAADGGNTDHKPSGLRKNRIVAPPPTTYASEAPSDVSNGGGTASRSTEARGKMLYAYQANGDGELTVDEGTEISIVEPDDGSGWMTVRANGSTGVVPAAYAELLPPPTPLSERPGSAYSNSSSAAGSVSTTATGKKKGPAVAPKRGAKKLQYVEALYDYAAQSDAEFNMSEGDRFVLINKDTGDGWADVERGGQVKSVPANYIQET